MMLCSNGEGDNTVKISIFQQGNKTFVLLLLKGSKNRSNIDGENHGKYIALIVAIINTLTWRRIGDG